MIDLTALELDWKLALKRYKNDIHDDFWPDPLGCADLFASMDDTVLRLEKAADSFIPLPAVDLYIPKSNYTLRHAVQMRPIDRIVYQALVDKLAPLVDAKLSPSSYGYRLRSPDSPWMFLRQFPAQWNKFNGDVRDLLVKEPASWLVKTDITSYFSNLRFRTLSDRLRGILVGEMTPSIDATLKSLFDCLKVWAPQGDVGLPQNMAPSSFLGNVFLDSIDKKMERMGFTCFRWVDDFKIVAPDEATARRAMIALIDELRNIGLDVNASKTVIVGPDDDGMKKVHDLPDPFFETVEGLLNGAKNRGTVERAAALLFDKMHELLLQGGVGESVFRFSLGRIVDIMQYKDVTHPLIAELPLLALGALRRWPEASEKLCRFLSVMPFGDRECRELEKMLTGDPIFVYPWQNYQLWLLATQMKVQSAAITRRAHQLLSGDGHDPEVMGATLYLAQCGDYTDHHSIKRYVNADASHMVTRARRIAVQALQSAERTPEYRTIKKKDFEGETLVGFIEHLADAQFVPAPPRINAETLRERGTDPYS